MYELPPHRYRELKHFCLQYGDFVKIYEALCFPDEDTENTAINKVEYEKAIRLIEMTAYRTSVIQYKNILESVTMDTGYKEFSGLRRRFFWLLDREKGII